MPTIIKKFEFDEEPREIKYFDNEPLILTNKLCFFHNKNKFRRELNPLQYLFKHYTGDPLLAAGIRDSYIKEEYSENFLIVIFTTIENIKKTNEILKERVKKEIKNGCFYLESTSEFMLLIAKEMEGLKAGLKTMEMIFDQSFKDYLEQGNFEEYVKIPSFYMVNCSKQS